MVAVWNSMGMWADFQGFVYQPGEEGRRQVWGRLRAVLRGGEIWALAGVPGGAVLEACRRGGTRH